MERKVLFTGSLDEEERRVLMRYALEIGDAATCRTSVLLRPLTGELLEKAFREREKAIEARERKYIEQARTFDPAKASPEQLAYFGADLTAERFGKYIAELIKQEEDAKRMLRREYYISVDYVDVTPEDMAFHESLHPVVTFGETNSLHEFCSFPLTPEIRSALQDSSLGDSSEEGFEYGYFYVGKAPLYYEDLSVTKGGEPILSTLTNIAVFDLFLTDAELYDFRDFELNKQRNYRIVNKLLS